MTGPMQAPDGSGSAPARTSFEVDCCTVARWHEGQFVEELLYYDLVSCLRQIRLSDQSDVRVT